MVSVAKSLDAPIKLLFPRPDAAAGERAARSILPAPWAHRVRTLHRGLEPQLVMPVFHSCRLDYKYLRQIKDYAKNCLYF